MASLEKGSPSRSIKDEKVSVKKEKSVNSQDEDKNSEITNEE